MHLRILATTDLHMHLRPFDYFSGSEAQISSLTGLATTIQAARQEAANCLLVDNGDFLQGTPMSDMIAAPEMGWPADEIHPALAAMNALNYDVGTLGNHEFNFGLRYLGQATKAAQHPIVLSNARFATPTRINVQADVILTRTFRMENRAKSEIRIGVMGFVPPQILEWDARHLLGQVHVTPILETAQRQARALRAAGADIVLALCHSGIGHPGSVARGEDVGLALARLGQDIDALVLGHSHLQFPQSGTPRSTTDIDDHSGRLAGVPCAMAGANASHLGVIDLRLRQRDAGGWRVVSGTAHLRPCAQSSDTASARRVLAVTQTGHEKTLAYIRRPVGQTDVAFHTYFAALGMDQVTALVAEAQIQVARQALAGTHFEGLPLLSAAAPFKAGGRGGPANFTDIAPGPLANRHVADLYHYPNTISAIRVTGAQLRDWLERAAGLFATLGPDHSSTLQPLVDRRFPIYNFDTIFGLTYQIDPSQPARFHWETGEVQDPQASRIQNLLWQGQPVEEKQEFVVTTNSYRAGGGGSFPGLAAAQKVMTTDLTTREAILAHLACKGRVCTPSTRVWRFAGLGGIRAAFETSPKARSWLTEPGLPQMQDLGDAPSGFARFEITL